MRGDTAHDLTDLSPLDRFAGSPFPPGIDPKRRTFYSPVDDVHGALLYALNTAQRSLVVAMYGFDDDELAKAMLTKLQAEDVYVQLTLDSSQAGGVHERTLLSTDAFPASTIAIGRSERGAIMHLKELVVDGTIMVTGSTNWSQGGESLQDNQCSVSIDPYAAALATARIGAIHANMLAKAGQGKAVDAG